MKIADILSGLVCMGTNCAYLNIERKRRTLTGG